MSKQVASSFYSRAELLHLKTRIELLEEATFKAPKEMSATEAQRFLIFYHLGYLDEIERMDISQTQKHLRIGVLLDIHKDNVKKFYNGIRKKDSKIKTAANYIAITEYFTKIGDLAKVEEMRKILEEIERNQAK